MTIEIPDTMAGPAGLTPRQALIDVAIGVYKRDLMSMGRCAKIVGMTRIQFQKELGKRKIPVNYDESDLENDLETITTIETTRNGFPVFPRSPSGQKIDPETVKEALAEAECLETIGD